MMKLTPIVPFEPIRSDEIPEGPEWIAQVKWDGVRVLTYYDGDEVKLFNRRLNERTFHYPELTEISAYCSAKSAILDGEIIALKNGKPSFYEVMKRDGIKNLDNVKAVQRRVPITYMIFDIIYLNNQWVTSYPLSERQKMLTEMITPNDEVQLVTNFADGKKLFEAIKLHNLEGVVFKDLTSTYTINGKDGRWMKKKYYRDLIAVVGGVTRRDATVNSLLLGLYDQEGRLWYIGNAGTGKLTQKDWQDISAGIKPLIQETMPFANKPERSKGAVWLKPELTVKVTFAEWVDGHTLRQPSIQAFVKVPPHECLLPVVSS
jgi:bifunctional non-homologous end joining protein LigD